MIMPTISCEMLGSWTKRAGGQHTITVSSGDLMRSAAIVGMPLLSTVLTDERPLLEMMWRMMMVKANLRATKSGKFWTRSEAYDRLDPSEKVAVSYFLGMLQSHLVATKLLKYTHLVHVDRLLQLEKKSLAGKRPDFVAIHMAPGTPQTRAATWESKGRTNAFDSKALKDAKEQAKLVPMLKGFKPRETVASEAYFAKGTDAWSAKLRDPEWEGEYLSSGLETYLLAYYQPLIAAGRSEGVLDLSQDAGLFRFTVPEFEVTVSLPEKLVDAVDIAGELEGDEREDAAVLSTAFRQLRSAATRPTPDLVVTTFEGDPMRLN